MDELKLTKAIIKKNLIKNNKKCKLYIFISNTKVNIFYEKFAVIIYSVIGNTKEV